MIPPSSRSSENFHTLKAASIVAVAVGHFVEPTYPLVWFPVALTMLAFAYSSAYFTAVSYGEDMAPVTYWRRKVLRLGPNLFVIDLFLIGLALLRGKTGILTWQGAVSLAGLGGFLNWFGLPNPSPFGAGTWFFSLLLLFYAAYPWLVRAYATRLAAWTLVTASGALLYGLSRWIVYGHALWLTVFGFLFGIAAAKHPVRGSPALSWVGLSGALVLTAALNASGVKAFNFFLLIGIFVPFVLLWHEAKVPGWVHRTLAPLRGCMLEIYLIHTALFVRPTGQLAVDLVASLTLVVTAALTLQVAAAKVRALGQRGWGAQIV